MPVNGMDDARLVIWPDADLAGDKHSSKATGGYWVELQCREHCWPLAWSSKGQTDIDCDLDGRERDHLDAAMSSKGRFAVLGGSLEHAEH